MADILYREAISGFETPQCVVVEFEAENKKWTDHILKFYIIQNITVTSYHVTTKYSFLLRYMIIPDTLPKLSTCSNQLDGLLIDKPPVVVWTNEITVCHMVR